jgi:hypothetical protein
MQNRRQWLIFLVVLLAVIVLIARERFQRAEVFEDYVVATAQIVKYSDSEFSVEGKLRTITYKYMVAGVGYTRTVDTSKKIPACDDVQRSECRELKFIVLISSANHENSLVNFEITADEIEDYTIHKEDFL